MRHKRRRLVECEQTSTECVETQLMWLGSTRDHMQRRSSAQRVCCHFECSRDLGVVTDREWCTPLPSVEPATTTFINCCPLDDCLSLHQNACPGVHLLSPGLLQLTAVRHQ